VQECDSQLQRALNYVEYDTAQEIRNRRTNIDNILSGIQVFWPIAFRSVAEESGQWNFVRARISGLPVKG
jgi:hypothetical protein